MEEVQSNNPKSNKIALLSKTQELDQRRLYTASLVKLYFEHDLKWKNLPADQITQIVME